MKRLLYTWRIANTITVIGKANAIAVIGKAIMVIGCCLLVFGTLSCSDFDDYNKVVTDANAAAGQTLWENIKGNAQLSDFAALVQKAGFDDELNQTKCYTIWAPLNGTYNAATFQSMDNSALMRQFVKNHIANYAHSASGKIDGRVLMLNEKSYGFTGSQTYTFDDVTLREANLPSSNGLLHTLDGVATFYPNLYEFVTDSTLAVGKDIDSLRHFFQKYETTYLDTEASVVGSIVNGMQTYVDSVMVTVNTLWRSLNGQVQNEDSTYTFLMPTNRAWKEYKDRIKSYYSYLPSTTAQNFNGATIATVTTSPIDNAFWQDSLASRYLTHNLIFSNNDAYNQWLEKSPTYLGSDTLRSTTRAKLSNPADILAQTKVKLKMSNGVARIVDSLAFYPWETYAPELNYNMTIGSYQGRVVSGYAQTVTVENPDLTKVDLTEISRRNGSGDFSYLYVEPNGSAKPELDVYLPDVLSTTYEIYCVFVPQNVELGDTSVVLPNRVVFTLNYCDANGKLQNYVFKDESEANKQWISEYYEECKAAVIAADPSVKISSSPDAATITAFSNDVTKVDTLFVGEFTFPVSYYGLSNTDRICPNLKITSPFSVFNKALLTGFERGFRISSIILKPKELVEFEDSKKQ